MFYKKLVAHLGHSFEDHQNDYDSYVQPLTYGNNTQVDRTTKTSSFSLVLNWDAPELSLKIKLVLQKSTVHRHW